MRLIFMGTPDFALVSLKALVATGHDIVAVYSQPPRQAGRGKALRPSPVQAWAEANNLTVRTPVSFKNLAEVADYSDFDADIAVVAAYGLILPQAVLDGPANGCLNIHASLLPRWRGAAPIQRAIQAGDTETGVTIMQMEAGLDTGPMLLRRAVSIRSDTTGGSLHDELAALGSAMIVEALEQLTTLSSIVQGTEGVTYAHKIGKAEARVDWSLPAVEIERTVRAFNPFPGAWFGTRGQRIRILRANVVPGNGVAGTVLDDGLTIACGCGALQPTVVQRQGRTPMTVENLLRGFAIPAGTVVS